MNPDPYAWRNAYSLLLAWLTNAIKDRDISTPTPDDIFWIVLESKLMSQLWTDVYGSVSPRALDEKQISKLISDLISTYHFKLKEVSGWKVCLDPSFHEAKDQRKKQISKQRSKIRRRKAVENRRQEAVDFTVKNPRKYGNGKWDETYPEYYLCFERKSRDENSI